jgi:hypothetical protein
MDDNKMQGQVLPSWAFGVLCVVIFVPAILIALYVWS